MASNLRVAVAGRSYEFPPSQEIVIGRGDDSTIQIQDPLVSRHHLRVSSSGGIWSVTDLSRNGTFTPLGQCPSFFPLDGSVSVRLGDPESPVIVAFATTGDPDQTVLRSPGVPKRVITETSSGLVIGRDASCDVVVPDLKVSRRHARLTTSASGRAQLLDLGSSNGTYVNGSLIRASTELHEGDQVGVGNTVLDYRGGSLVASTARAHVLAAVDATVRTAQGKVLLDEVSLVVDAGDLVAVAGPSGAGKSTMIGVLTGSRLADQGAVLVEGWDLALHRNALHDHIGYVPQDDVVHRALTVRQVMDYAAQLRLAADVTATERAQRIAEVLTALGLEPNADQRVSTLSGGQRKRVNIALELLAKPRLLVLDEPTSGLDPGTDHSLMVLLRELSRQGQAVVVVTHSLAAIEACDRVVFIRVGGRLAYDGPPGDAPEKFGAPDLVGVYADLNIAGPSDERQRQRLRGTAPRGGAPSATPVRTSAQQLSILTRRYLSCLSADRRNLMILLLQAPVLGLLTRTLVEDDGLSAGAQGNPNVSRVLLTLVLSITWLGGANGIREIVKELSIYERERGTGITIPAYLGSKLLVLGCITVLQAAVLNTVALVGKPMPSSGAFLPNATVELFVDISAAGVGSLALALLVSAITSNADKAMTALPLLLVPQLILSGGLMDLSGKPVLQLLSNVATARWGYSAAASTVNLEAMTPSAPPVPAGTPAPAAAVFDRLWKSDPATWLFDIGMLALLTIVFLAIAAYGLRARDPKRH